jgi:CS domain
MSTSPTPSERERTEKEAKAKEEAEQAALPYKWTQTIQDVDIVVPIDTKYRGKDLDVKIGKNTLRVAIKGGEVFIDVCHFFMITSQNPQGSINTVYNTTYADGCSFTRVIYRSQYFLMSLLGLSKQSLMAKRSVSILTR